jgi:Protein of unknown function (DUF1688)
MLALAGRLPNFDVDLDRLPDVAKIVIDVTHQAYPSLDIPFHSRWRHFQVGADDRWKALDRDTAWPSAAVRARAALDLAIVSVLLDAGAGPAWRFRDARSGQSIGRSEGLAIASFEMFRGGLFSSKPQEPLRVDADKLARVDLETMSRGFQVAPGNPLVAIDGRVDLLQRLGRTVLASPRIFGREDAPQPGGFFDHLITLVEDGKIAAPAILSQVLTHFGPIWPSRISVGGVALGDCWRHFAIVTADETDGLVPFHKLSQWLTYSLIEPLREAGIDVVDIDGLTGLAEYRNGGLFIDTGVLNLRDAGAAQGEHTVDSELVVEWRALTVALLDRLADLVRSELGMNSQSLPLARVLQGGTWVAGRNVAKSRRPDGSPPLKIVSDGTVF